MKAKIATYSSVSRIVDRDLADRRPALRDAVRQPAGEIGLEISDRVAERVEMGAPADHVGALRHQDLVGEDLVGEVQHRPHEQDRAAGQQELRAVIGPEPVGRRAAPEYRPASP